MTVRHYYNEFDERNVYMLRQLMSDGFIPEGDIDGRSITEVTAADLKGYTSCHFFAGVGGWSRALFLAQWPEDRPVWTGSCPCQPFSSAGKQKGKKDERHLWPVWFRLIKECRSARIYGEQVASAISHGWLDGVYADMEEEGYAIGSAVLPACAVDAPHKRYRLWFVADSHMLKGGLSEGSGGPEDLEAGRGCESLNGPVAHGQSHELIRRPEEIRTAAGRQKGHYSHLDRQPSSGGDGLLGNAISARPQGHGGSLEQHDTTGRQVPSGYLAETGFWGDYDWIVCADGKARRVPTVESGICLLGHGIPARVATLYGFGNAIVPEVAARFIQATM